MDGIEKILAEREKTHGNFTATQEEAYYLRKWLDNHHKEAFITCEETCECWEVSEKIDKALEAMGNG